MTGGEALFLAVKLLWSAAALATLVRSLWLWCKLRRVERSRLTATASPAVRTWHRNLVRSVGLLSLVAACNLGAGLYSLAVPTRPDAEPPPPRDLVGWAPLVVPALFIVSAGMKYAIAACLDAGYDAVTGRRR